MSEEISAHLSDEELLLKLSNPENNFVERKIFSDHQDWLRTVVGFANSCPVGYPGILFIGVYDDGTPEQPKEPVNLDSIQKTLTKKANEAWPPIYFLPKVLRKDSQQILAVLVPGSSLRPHFAGQSFVRVGSETKKASESQYEELIAQRNAKPYEILRWKGQVITMEQTYSGRSSKYPGVAKVVGCNAFYVTLLRGKEPESFPLTRVDLSFDDGAHRLKLEIREHAI